MICENATVELTVLRIFLQMPVPKHSLVKLRNHFWLSQAESFTTFE